MVTCALCGKEFMVISSDHVVKKHGITYKEYKETYGNTGMELVGEQVSARKKERYSSRKGNEVNKFEESGDLLYLIGTCLGNEYVCVLDVDEKDKFYAHPNTWVFHVDPRSRGAIRVCSRLPGSRSYRERVDIGRFILGLTDPKIQVDHINGDTLDNRKINLRAVHQSGNKQNTHGAYKNSKTGVRGVWFSPRRGKYEAAVKVNGVQKTIGFFDTVEAAERAVKKARVEMMPYSEDYRNHMQEAA